MVIYLKHPKHGKKVAASELEAATDEKNGWVRFDPSVTPVLETPAFLAPVEHNELAKRGRKKTV